MALELLGIGVRTLRLGCLSNGRKEPECCGFKKDTGTNQPTALRLIKVLRVMKCLDLVDIAYAKANEYCL